MKTRLLLQIALICLLLASAVTATAQPANCFPPDDGARSTDWNAHHSWAESQNLDNIKGNIAHKLEVVFRCRAVQRDDLRNLYADLSMLLVNYSNDPRCYHGDTGAVNTDRNAHYNFAQSHRTKDLLGNIENKTLWVMDCLRRRDRVASLFADMSVTLVGGTPQYPPGQGYPGQGYPGQGYPGGNYGSSFADALQRVIYARHGWNGVIGNYGNQGYGNNSNAMMLPGADRCFINGDPNNYNSAYVCIFRGQQQSGYNNSGYNNFDNLRQQVRQALRGRWDENGNYDRRDRDRDRNYGTCFSTGGNDPAAVQLVAENDGDVQLIVPSNGQCGSYSWGGR